MAEEKRTVIIEGEAIDEVGEDVHPLLTLLVESAENPDEVQALRTIVQADRDEVLVNQMLQGQVPPLVSGILMKKDANKNQVSTDVRTRPVKKSTPERIRKRAAKLYEEIHDLIDQYNIRKQREKYLSSGRRPMDVDDEEVAREVIAKKPEKAVEPSSHIDRMAAGLPAQGPERKAKHQALPNLKQSFQEARQRHLEEAERERAKFPLQQRTGISEKDPSAFSLRFQITDRGDVASASQ